ncbi:MAG: response regulator [Candidatus Falkowbacteria bacterium]|nr:MAG: response regulator [Candidatus Falkowbacteria bacterium]
MEKTLKKRILLAEDERSISRALKLKLEMSGFEVEIAVNGEEALNLLKTKKFDLLLLDIMMPKMDGFSVMEEMKKRKDKTPILVLSNLSQEDDAKRAKSFGTIDFCIKSNSPLAEIIDKIKRFLKV